AESPLRKIAIVAAMIVVLVPGFPVVVAMAAIPGNETGKLGATNSPACRFDDSATILNALSPAKMFAPLDLGPALLLQTHHGVVATGHHRATEAMHDVIAAFLASPDEAHMLVRDRGADYVLICTELGEAQLYT